MAVTGYLRKGASARPSLASIFLTLVGLFFIILVGALVAIFPPLLLITFFSLPVVVVLAAAFPAGALFLALIVTFGLMPPFVFASMPLGNATIRPHELMLFATFALVVLKGLKDWYQILPATRPLWGAFAILAMALVIGLVQGKLYTNNPSALADFRQFSGWLALPVAMWLTWRNENSVHRIIMMIALIASAAMLFQLLSGIQVIYGFRGAEELSKEFQDVKRSAIGGGVLLLCYAGYYLFFRVCDADRGRGLSFVGLLLILGGLVATFTRGIWLGFFIGGVVFFALTPKFRIGKTAVIIMVALAGVSAGLAMALAAPRVTEALVDRVVRVGDEGGRGTSFGYRIDENRQAWAAIKSSPLIGNGLGAQFKTTFNQTGATSGFSGDESSFIHNAYLNLWVKLGLVGLLYPVLLLLFLFRHIQVRRKRYVAEGMATGRDKLIREIAAYCCLVATAFYGMSSNEWSVFTTLAPLSCLIAILVSNRISDDSRHSTPRKNRAHKWDC